MARRRWIADEWQENTAALTGAQARHLARVLRAEPGMRCDVVAGNEVWAASVTAVADERVEFALEQQLPSERSLGLVLLLAVFKFDRLEWAIEKATELGVREVLPVIAQRTEKHLAQAATARVERWRRIAHEAAKQSRRSDMLHIADPVALRVAVSADRPERKLLLAESERMLLLRDALSEDETDGVALAIGPEGGWTEAETQLFATNNWTAVSLGPRILRAETAAIAAAAIAASLLGH